MSVEGGIGQIDKMNPKGPVAFWFKGKSDMK